MRELVSEGARLRELVLVVREHEVEPTAVDLEHGAEELLGHHRALDVPPRTAPSPRRIPCGVFARLVRLPEREVTRILLQRIRTLLFVLTLHRVGALARQLPVVRIGR